MLYVKTKNPACNRIAYYCAIALAIGVSGANAQTSDLVSKKAFRVCADPANYPMSDQAGNGYENKIAELIASKLELPVEYTWYPMATGFIRNSLRANKCDAVIGYAQGHELVANTNHYLTSTFVIVAPKDSELADVDFMADERLKGKKLGVVAGSPPATHMARNGLIAKAKPYHLVVDRRHESPIIDMLNDVKTGETDAALIWGPIAGPLVKKDFPQLKITPLTKETLPPRMYFRITMGVRPGERVWVRKLNSLLRRNKKEINAILADAGVPLMNDLGTAPLGETN